MTTQRLLDNDERTEAAIRLIPVCDECEERLAEFHYSSLRGAATKTVMVQFQNHDGSPSPGHLCMRCYAVKRAEMASNGLEIVLSDWQGVPLPIQLPEPAAA